MRDLRLYARQTNIRLVIGFFVLLILVGLGLIYVLWGQSAAVSGLICIAAALFPVGLIWILLTLLGWLVRKVDQ